jgi:SAM-dependent methyltransferase
MTDRSSAAEQYYARYASELLNKYESVAFEAVHANLLPYLPAQASFALDVGAGSGRDSAWLAQLGWSVVAAEPSEPLRKLGRRLHPHARIRWIDDALPRLPRTQELALKFDLILLSAVWMHVPPEFEEAALSVLADLSAQNAILSISVRKGGDEGNRGFYTADLDRVKEIAPKVGLSLVTEDISGDSLGRSAVSWSGIILRRESGPSAT